MLAELQKQFDFLIENDKQPGIVFFNFKDGRKYKFQIPLFFELHSKIVGKENWLHELFLLCIERAYPENSKSPKLDEAYFNAHRNEGILLWTPLFREVVFRD